MLAKQPKIAWPTVECQCDVQECVCGTEERVLRAFIDRKVNLPMNSAQREWCLQELDSVEGFSRKDYTQSDDSQLARGVLDAWHEYCLDKGLL